MKIDRLILTRQESPETSRPWRFLETVKTADGPRTRIIDGMWGSAEEAIAALKERLEEDE